VSLGAYQGGYLYALGEELKREHVRIPLLVGASAGTINALLLGATMCRGPVPEPTDSPLRDVWMRASLAQLRQGRTTSPSAVFPQDGVRAIAQSLRTLLTKGIDPGCDFVLSAETSRLRPRPVPVDGHDTIPDIQEPFTIRIKTGADGFPRITNYVPDDPFATHALLPFPLHQDTEPERAEALDLLIDLVLASSAFPGAFPQVLLRHCLTDREHPEYRHGGRTECGMLDVYARTPFIDGGVLDNTPVGLAIRTALSGISIDARGKASWNEPRPASPERPLPPGLSYLLVDTDNDAYDPLPTRPRVLGSLLAFAATFASGFVGAARGRELYETLDHYPPLREHLTVSQLHPRLASRYLLDFFGFFDTRLRDFDFTAGMYDAARLIGDGRLEALLAGAVQRAEVAPRLEDLGTPTTSWRKLACMAQAYGRPRPDGAYDRCSPISRPEAPPAWQSVDADAVEPDFDSFVELLQASLDQLYSQCLCARDLSDRPLGDACARLVGPKPAVATAAQLSRPPRIRSEFALGDSWAQVCTRGADGTRSSEIIEDPLAYAIRRLARYRFAGASAAETATMIRERIGTLADDAIERQPIGERVAAILGGPSVLDVGLGYAPPENSVHVVSGLATEVGWTHGRWLRGTAALQAKGWSNGFALTPLAGIDWNVPYLPALAQVHPFARVGFQLGNSGPGDAVGPSPCWRGFDGHAERCIVGQAGLAVTAFDLVRLQGVWEQSTASAARWTDHVLVEFGLQANWPLGPR
jgi:predicted acylesterase/phospholipase RssA